jgi:hypothetical protein
MTIHFNPFERKMSKEKFKFFKKLARVWEKQPLNVLNMDISLASIIDDFVKSLKRRISVIPENPGSRPGQAPESSHFKYLKILWTPVFGELSRAVSTGVTTFYENIIIGYGLKLLWPSPNSFPRPGSRHRRV